MPDAKSKRSWDGSASRRAAAKLKTQPLPSSVETRNWIWNLAAAAALAFVLWLLYFRSFHLPFILDDQFNIEKNPSITHLWPPIGNAETPGPLNPPLQLSTSGRPLVNLSLALNYHIGHLDEFGYHVFNVVLHWLSALLLWAIVRRTLALDYFQGRFAQR